jgi:V/A-type H+-transporting ATPase subunit I
MIVKMSKAYIAVRQIDRDRLLEKLGQLDLVHFDPVEPEMTVADEETLTAMADLDRAIQILSSVKPSRNAPSQSALETAREAIAVQTSIKDNQDRLKDLYARMRDLAIWGDVRLMQFEYLRENGIEVRFYVVPREEVDDIEAECCEMLSSSSEKWSLVGVIDRSGQFKMPQGAEPISLPSKDRAAILAEAEKCDMELKQGYQRLSELAASTGTLREARERLVDEAAFIKAQRSGWTQGELFAVQGWLPTEMADQLRSRLTGDGFYAAVLARAAEYSDVPPTLIRYSKWARPVKGLFDILGTLPGYREMDLSPFFMLALPVFAAMLIGDAGYGFIISLFALIFHGRLVRLAGRPQTQIILIFGLVTLIWGILTANYFGITPETLARGGGFVKSPEAGAEINYEALWAGEGFYGHAAKMMRQTAPFWREDPRVARFLMIKVSLLIGCIHLILARLRKMVELIPDQRALAEFGWVIVLAGMLVLIWHLLFVGVDRVPTQLWWVLLAAVLLCSWFGKPEGKGGKRILVGFASSMLPFLSTFSDTMSYIRLFAVGLASYYIASAFNALAVQIAEAATWFSAVPVLVFGHGLNIGLAAIAIFAHGVRLNMLEFSNNVGVQWGGYAYRPFTRRQLSISGEDIP